MPAKELSLSKMNITDKFTHFFTGDVTYKPDGRYGPVIQPYLQLVYFYNGTTTVTEDDRKTEYCGGDAFFMIPHRRYYFNFDPTESVRHGWVNAEGTPIPAAIDPHVSGPPGRRFPFTPRMAALAEIMLTIPRHQTGIEGDLRTTLSKALIEEALISSRFVHNKHRLHPYVERLIRTIESGFREPHDASSLARAVGITPTHLARLTKLSLGKSPVALLWQRRLDESAYLLRETGLSVSEVAYQCGFQSPYHFSRKFAQQFGAPPSQTPKRCARP